MTEEQNQWYVYIQEQTYGPVDSETLIQWYNEGRLEGALVHDGVDWRTLDQIDILTSPPQQQVEEEPSVPETQEVPQELETEESDE